MLRGLGKVPLACEHSLCRCCGKIYNSLSFKKMLSRRGDGEIREKITRDAKIFREAVMISGVDGAIWLSLARPLTDSGVH